MVPPDYALVAAMIASSRGSKVEAVQAAAAALDSLTTDLIAVRAFELMDGLGAVLAVREAVTVDEVSWHVDWDNPAWPGVRADAVQAAIAKGRDYAAALGGSLRGVEHIADAGLLNGGGAPSGFAGHRAMTRAASLGGAEPDAPSLDPVPQELAAVIEARFTADGVSLAEH